MAPDPRAVGIVVSLVVLAAVASLARGQQGGPPAGPAAPSWLSGAAQARPTGPESRRDCVVCHLEWADAFERPGASLLIDRPPVPVVADQQTCLGCHDGSVGDARLRVWAENGHRTGVAPPPTMQVPEGLPLTDGRITCRTCHTAHGGTGPQTIATIVFLRMPNESGQLCQACHSGMTGGVSAGTHTLGSMPWPIPQRLLDAGAKAGPAEYRLVCQTCHTAHGSRQEQLLVMGTESSQLCLTCHEKMRPGMFRPDVPREHPQNPPLQTDAQRQAIAAMGTRIGAGDTLICLSCHKVHHGLSGRFLLADTMHNSNLCIRCHPQRAAMIGTEHDLRSSAPDARNRLGMTPEESGPCGACHSFHTFARRPSPVPGDPTGLCGTCHEAKGPAASKSGQPFSHPADLTPDMVPPGIDLKLYPPFGTDQPPRLACLTCHDPHEVNHGSFLRTTSRDRLCATCHAEQALRLPEAHNFLDRPDARNGRDQPAKDTGRCGFCHAVHDATGPSMWVASRDSPRTADQLCTICHSAGGLGEARPTWLFSHPTGAAAPADKATVPTDLPLFDALGRRVRRAMLSQHRPGASGNSEPVRATASAPGAQGFVACGSCHDPHIGSPDSPSMLRGGRTTPGLCIDCHEAQAGVAGSPHDRAAHPGAWPKGVPSDTLCLACHVPHSNDPAKGLWTVARSAEAPTPADGVCVSCHPDMNWAAGGGTPSVGRLVHPRAIAAPHDVQDLPVLPAQHDTRAALECRTCHDPHAGRMDWLFRRTQSPQRSGVCLVCHPDSAFLEQSLHAAWVDPSLKPDKQVCGPCHATHAIKGSLVTDLWAAGLAPSGHDLSQRECLACHGSNGPGKAVQVVQHPDVMVPPAPRIESISAAVPRGIMPNNRVTCITCHLPHGQMQPTLTVLPSASPGEARAAARRAGAASAPTSQAAIATLRASKPMVRMNVSAQVCAVCHGFDAARRFLYWHKPQMRQGGALPFVPPAGS